VICDMCVWSCDRSGILQGVKISTFGSQNGENGPPEPKYVILVLKSCDIIDQKFNIDEENICF
jgi:hypothetical protein